MVKNWFILFFLFIGVLMSCSRKTIPSKSASVIPSEKNTSEVSNKPAPVKPMIKQTDVADSLEVITEKPEPPVVKEKPKADFPKVISVNDDAASKSVDGRLFYDVLGHRYWKNFNDGKYYLFDKAMYNNPDFKPPK